MIQLNAPCCRWSPFPEFSQERSSVNLVSCGGLLYAVGGFAMVENENKECAPSEIIDIWQYVDDTIYFFLFTFAVMTPLRHCMMVTCFHYLTRYEEDKKQWTGMIREMRYAAGASVVSMCLNAARMPKL